MEGRDAWGSIEEPTAPHSTPIPALTPGRSSLNILVQVNVSGEASKYGVEPDGCIPLVQHVVESCPRLCFRGLMTIGKIGDVSPKYFEVRSKPAPGVVRPSRHRPSSCPPRAGAAPAGRGGARVWAAVHPGGHGAEHGHVRRL